MSSPETFNIRTGEPVKNGLFCERIFGPLKQAERRSRFGHITLAAPVVHPWYYGGAKSIIARLLGLPSGQVKRIVRYELYIVIEPGSSGLKPNQVLFPEEYGKYVSCSGFHAATGAKAIMTLLKRTDLEALSNELKKDDNLSFRKRDRLSCVNGFLQSGNRPEWLIIEMLPVLPPDLRPVLFLDNGSTVASDLNLLYSRVIYKNQSLRRLIHLNAPEIILHNAKRLLQAAVDNLLDNGRNATATVGSRRRPLKSLSDMVRAKNGRFRLNLLAKRVDYSGRAQITIGPDLKIHQVGIPKIMALELFKPFIYRWLVDKGFAPGLKQARGLVENEKPEVWDALDDVIAEHPVIINRAPTLHKLSMQAFEPVLMEGKAIRLHPLVCAGFNADFDGDAMAVHVPLSLEARIETMLLIMSVNNLFHPASGKPALLPSQDIVLGVYYLTQERKGRRGEGMFFSGVEEVCIAYDNKIVEEHAAICVRIDSRLVSTTAGRVLFYSIIPAGIPFEAINKEMKKKDLAALIELCCEKCGPAETIRFLDAVKEIGFKYATLSGTSICLDDMQPPPGKAAIVDEALKEAAEARLHYKAGLMSDNERHNKEIGIWTRAIHRITSEVMPALRKEYGNSLFLMADSGARGDINQIRQVTGLRGLMAKPTGEIVDLPILSNFREGLTPFEFFLSTHGARKGRVDAPLSTPVAGHLTRRLVSAARDIYISMEDCGTVGGICVKSLVTGGSVLIPLQERIDGRVLADNVLDPNSRTVIAAYGALIDEDIAAKIAASGIESVKVRSVLTCRAKSGVCASCYGRNVGSRMPAEIGDAVGIIAAQSIGEPGTQLTLRTFHSGGTAVAPARASVAGETVKTMDITGGLPDVIELFEAGGPRRPVLHELLRSSGAGALWTYLLDELQKIYRQQGVVINDKHFEVIIRQMTGFVEITDRAETKFLEGDIVSRNEFQDECDQARRKGKRPPAAAPVLLGISHIPRYSTGFLASASFQRTTSVLADAAFKGRVDELQSNASRIITGKLVRTGTGLFC